MVNKTVWKMFTPLALTLMLVPLLSWAEVPATVKAKRVEIPRIYRLDGVVEVSHRSTISAQTNGQVTKVAFDVDDFVKAGDVIVVIANTEQAANLASAKANLAAAQARKIEAEKEYERIKRVFAKQAVSKSSMDKATSTRQSTRAEVGVAQAALQQAEQQLNYTQVRAPFTGVVTERFVEVGEIASRGQSLMSGISLERLRVDVDVPQSMINAVRKHKDAMIEVNGQWLKASKITVFPVADRATYTFRVRLQLPDGVEGVFPGMSAKVTLRIGQRSVLVVPKSALVFRSEVMGVYVLDEQGLVSFRHVRVGESLIDGRYTILSGLEVGELVALDPHAAILTLKAQRQEQLTHE